MKNGENSENGQNRSNLLNTTCSNLLNGSNNQVLSLNGANLNTSMPMLQIPGLSGLVPMTTSGVTSGGSMSNLINTTFPMVKMESNNSTDDAMQMLLKSITGNNNNNNNGSSSSSMTPVKTEAQENQEMVNSLLGLHQTSTPVKNQSPAGKSEEAMQILLKKISQPDLKMENNGNNTSKSPEMNRSSSQGNSSDMVLALLNNIKSGSDTSGVISESSQANLASCLSSLIQKNDK